MIRQQRHGYRLLISEWREVASIADIGLTLDEDWSPAKRRTFVALAEDACASLATWASIPAEEIVAWPLLDDLRIHPRGATEVLTAPIVELGRAVVVDFWNTARTANW